jgi:hypothetical protein
MDTVERIRTTFERNARVITLRPAIGQGTAETEASEDDIFSRVDEADAASPYLHVFSRPQKQRRELRVSPRR